MLYVLYFFILYLFFLCSPLDFERETIDIYTHTQSNAYCTLQQDSSRRCQITNKSYYRHDFTNITIVHNILQTTGPSRCHQTPHWSRRNLRSIPILRFPPRRCIPLHFCRRNRFQTSMVPPSTRSTRQRHHRLCWNATHGTHSQHPPGHVWNLGCIPGDRQGMYQSCSCQRVEFPRCDACQEWEDGSRYGGVAPPWWGQV